MIKTSSELPWNSSAILEIIWKILENIWKRSCDLRASFGESSENFGQWSDLRTIETGRLFSRRRTKQLPFATNENVLGHVA